MLIDLEAFPTNLYRLTAGNTNEVYCIRTPTGTRLLPVTTIPDTYFGKPVDGKAVELSVVACTFDEARELAKAANAEGLALIDDFEDVKLHYVR